MYDKEEEPLSEWMEEQTEAEALEHIKNNNTHFRNLTVSEEAFLNALSEEYKF